MLAGIRYFRLKTGNGFKADLNVRRKSLDGDPNGMADVFWQLIDLIYVYKLCPDRIVTISGQLSRQKPGRKGL
ncbi:hypothetical protein MTBLM1_90095 [Rhodospirillaceae bacterium LM-1]|nr:hypothetical protein MTBLM1_90095 [Rhodospirillaceae bacterium LM-1]